MNLLDMDVKSMLIYSFIIIKIKKIGFFSTTFIGGEDDRDLKNLRLADIEIVCTLGVGGFGRVELVNTDFYIVRFEKSLYHRYKIQEIRRNIVLNK